MTAMLPAGLVIASLAAVDDPGAAAVDVAYAGARVSVLLTRRGSSIAAFINRCPHAGYPLQCADGRVVVQAGRYIVCGAHGASFEIETGACAGGPCNGEGLTRIPITVRDATVFTA
ncbi:MAG: Rieske 2Fe-2S domain-containing protein [Hyphomonadaceae bacterium]|nr:Rieske 2Fe-2S domain-containing protein [Hyphomonadaceae bacterium]